MHRDLKPDNILVDILPGGFKIIKITDFGLAKNDDVIQSTTLEGLTS
jgi:serine/threonine protein kinase